MRKSVRALCIAVALIGALLLAAAPALATYTHVFSTSFGEAGSGDGQLELAASTENGAAGRSGSGVAVNSSTRDVYVADTGNHRVDEFSASGAFIRAWGWGVADGTTEALQMCTSGCHAGLPGAGPGQLTEPSFITVDNSGGASQGDVYVADRPESGSAFVAKFSASGGYISSNDGSGAILPLSGPFGKRIGGIAVDNSGDLWVFAEGSIPLGQLLGEGDVFEFAQDGSFITDWTPHSGLGTSGIAVDSAHDIYARTVNLRKYTSSGALIGEVQGDSFNSPFGFAVNATTNDLYVDEGSPAGHGEQIARYASSCEPANARCTAVEHFGAGGELNHAESLTVDPSNDTVYASDIGDQRVAVFGRTPDVTTGAPQSRAATAAVVSGTVNPGNTAVSDCHFDYVADAEYTPGEPNPYAAGGTIPCDVTPSGAGQVVVRAEITGLTPGAIYHFRLVATNVYGTSFGADETVPGTLPAIDSASAADVASASAVLQASINPEGGDTTYRFEYGPTTGYGTGVPVPDGDIGSGVGDVSVSRRINGLFAGTVYHYRVVAHNLLGTTAGSDRTITTQPSGGGIADTCSNAAIRALQHAGALPDCRAYEQVSPVDKDGSPVLAALETRWQASPDGGAVTYTSTGVFADAQTGGAVTFPYLSSRLQGGWSTHSLLPPQAPGSILPFTHIEVYSKDLSKGILVDGGGTSAYGQDQPLLVPGEPHNVNLFLRDNITNSYQLIDVTPPSATPSPVADPGFIGSSDLSHVFFSESAQLTPDAPPPGAQPQLYEWTGGVVRLAGVLPDGTPVPASRRALVPEATSGPGANALASRAVSDDGSRVFFQIQGESGSSEGLYLRQDATSTVQLDVPHGPGPGGGGEFAVASSDGSQAFFVDDAAAGLTNDTVPGSGVNLYRYDANSRVLSDVTPAAGAEVQGVIGASEDGSYLYFVANGVLAPGASPGDCRSGYAARPAQTCSLYLYHAGAMTFIAALNGEDLGDWHEALELNDTATVSPDGHYLAFQSLNSITGYENLAANGVQCGTDRRTDAGPPQPRCAEVYLYDADVPGASGALSCASCNPSGGAPVGSSLVVTRGEQIPGYVPRYLSDSGRLFFNSLDALVPQDVNGQWDVYEFEPGGVGSCRQAQGCVSLVSSGASPDPSLFRDASVTGEDVFFTTAERLVAQDGDQSLDLYDARVGGGLGSQNEAPVAGCGGEACKAPAVGQPGEQAPGSSAFSGPGNPMPSPTVAVRRKSLTRAQKLARALRVCQGKPRRKRASCVAQAKRRYGASTRKANKAKRAKRANNYRRAGR